MTSRTEDLAIFLAIRSALDKPWLWWSENWKTTAQGQTGRFQGGTPNSGELFALQVEIAGKDAKVTLSKSGTENGLPVRSDTEFPGLNIWNANQRTLKPLMDALKSLVDSYYSEPEVVSDGLARMIRLVIAAYPDAGPDKIAQAIARVVGDDKTLEIVSDLTETPAIHPRFG